MAANGDLGGNVAGRDAHRRLVEAAAAPADTGAGTHELTIGADGLRYRHGPPPARRAGTDTASG